jgi:hypothetical protein
VKTLLAAAALSAALVSGVHAADITVNAPLNVLNIQGEIVEGDAAKIGNLAPQLTTARTITVILNSPGGQVAAAIDIAAMIEGWWWTHRETVVNVFVGGNDQCVSACVFVFSAGTHRIVEYGGSIGVHSFVDIGKGGETDASQKLTLEISRVLQKAGAPASVIGKLVATPPDQVAWLDRNDAAAWNIIMLPAGMAKGQALRSVANLTPKDSSPPIATN